jgi:BirA family transcriptional regulator, biotin operon repressor / biotin---[acetyl-CoA-carboxylase] ligase
MGLSSDLTEQAVTDALPGRAVRFYPAILSTEADALAWARAGAPHGAVVVADYQASPRGRGGFPWDITPGEGLGFSIVLQPDLPPHREGWMYVVAATALADIAGEDAVTVWPDGVRVGGEPWAALGVQTLPGPQSLEAAVVTLLVHDAPPPRGPLLTAIVEAVEARLNAPPTEVVGSFVARCETIGRSVRARLVPLGPAGQQVSGVAEDVKEDGALVLRTRNERRVAVRPQSLGVLEEAL